MQPNVTKQRLMQGKAVIGVGASVDNLLVPEALAQSGFDFILIDNQHGNWNDASNAAAFRAVQMGGATPMIRVQKNDYYTIGRALDRGAMGIIVPMVNSKKEAEAAARAVRFPPRGGRSIGPFGTSFLGENYVEEINDQVYLAVQIETATAVKNAREILSVEGVDGCWVGPGDMSLTMGVEQGAPEHEEAILSVLALCQELGKVPGLACRPNNAAYWLDKGFRFVTVGGELGLMRERATQVLQDLAPSRSE